MAWNTLTPPGGVILLRFLVVIYFVFQQSTPVILRDGNGAIYPLSHNCVAGVRDPMWLDLPPTRCLGLGFQTLQGVGPNCKNKVAVIAIGLEVSRLDIYSLIAFFNKDNISCVTVTQSIFSQASCVMCM